MQTVIKNPNWRRERTSLGRCFTLTSIVACIAVIDLVIGSEISLPKNQAAEELQSLPQYDSNKPRNVCLSAACNFTAAAVLRKLKTDVEPCDDFYKFSCGQLEGRVNMSGPGSAAYANMIGKIFHIVQGQLKEIITEKRPETDPKHFRLPNALYKACMNESLIESLGTKPIKDISDQLGGWPVITGSSWNSDDSWTWQETDKKLARLGLTIEYIVKFSIDVDLKNSTKRIIKLDQPSTGLEREYWIKGFNDNLVSAYYDYMVGLAVILGAEKEAAKRELREALKFEMALAKFSWSKEKRRNANDLYNLHSIKQLQESYPYVQWLDYINALLPDGLDVDENEVINLAVPSFFDELGNLLNRTAKRDIANYMMYRVHRLAVPYLTDAFGRAQLAFRHVQYGIDRRMPRWMDCLDIVSHSLPFSVGSLYVRKHFKEDSKAGALEMVNNIRNAFSQMLDEVKWMDDKTKQEAKKKINAMTAHIGYPDDLLDNDKLKEYHRKLKIDPDNYFQSFLNVQAFNRASSFNKLRLPVNKTDWDSYGNPTIINAYYNLQGNGIQLPAAILQNYFFGVESPKYMNYGAIGWVIGYAITNGFNDEGRRYDFDGNLNNWWQPDTEKAYLEEVKCIIEQYGNYTDKQTGLNLNGFNTQGSNIADNGGIKESYLAYNQWVAENGEEPKLPGLNYTSQQMFWISAAQTFCSTFRTEMLRMFILTGMYSPDPFRVLGSLRNRKEFSRDFQCPEGAPMNPIKKCEVW